MILHAGKHILGSLVANCLAQDDTAVLTVAGSGKNPLGQEENNPEKSDHEKEEKAEIEAEKQIIPEHGCQRAANDPAAESSPLKLVEEVHSVEGPASTFLLSK